MPKHKIVGTQIPTNIACRWSPLNHKASEKIREIKAAANSNLSAMVNLLNIFLFLFPTHMAFRFRPVFDMGSGLHNSAYKAKQ